MTTTEIGIDVGSARTKVACGDRVWHGPSSTDVAGLLREVVRRDCGVEPDGAAAVVAVPDGWAAEGADGTWTEAVEHTSQGAELARVLTERAGFGSVRLVPVSQCVAAAHGETTGCVLVCDVGASAVTAAVYACEATTSRLLDSETARSEVRESLREKAGVEPAGLVAFDEHRCQAAERAVIVLERARTHQRYLGTPVYLPGVTAEMVLEALRPLATLAAALVTRVLERVGEPVGHVLLTGGNVLGPVEAAVRAAAGAPVHVLTPDQAARGAWRIAAGRATALDGYPHELGIGVRRIAGGLLESTTIPVGGRTPVTVEVETDHSGQVPVRVRIDRQGPWREAGQQHRVHVPRGTYHVTALGRRGGLGAVLLRPAGAGADIVLPLGAEAGPVLDGTT
ncbi:hypothetical protein [Lentzea sp. NBRC 102530]|uniref:hypothetical protein n=1 Tax=Lentzea sp. NBRC 102530 TaxID=3032201 RepID=UPI0024A4EF35|nr:hypothetical protein [Lentzea sp. NBRC 102530]GLY50786.1 hypothetical protein Lesp01_44420 [Lentzea sp. NBRC 102530]